MRVRDGMSETVLSVGPGHTLREAACLMARRRVGAAVVLDPEGQGPGIITERDVLNAIGAGQDPDGERVADHLTADVVFATPDWSLEEAAVAMVRGGFRHLIVTEGGEIAGIVTERDYLRRVTIEGRTEEETLVREIMTSPLVYVTPETSVEECMAVMTERRTRHLPVFTESRDLVGIVSIGDVVKFKSAEQDFQIKFLTEYIESG